MTTSSSKETEKFRELYDANRLDILKYLLRRSANTDEAADALAETFLVAWRRIDLVPDGHEGRLWLYGVARNVLFKQFKKKQHVTALNERLAVELRSVATTQGNDEVRGGVHNALSQLSKSDREIVELSAWEDLTPGEIASVLGISANAARVRLHRARHRLAGILMQPELKIPDIGREEASRRS